MMITLIILILIPFDVLLDRNKRRFPAGIYLLKVNNRKTRTNMCSGIFIVNL